VLQIPICEEGSWPATIHCTEIKKGLEPYKIKIFKVSIPIPTTCDEAKFGSE